jgi:predicted lipoprotein with Yx(FWY)xxD motif
MKKIDRLRFVRLLTVAVLLLTAAVLTGGASAANQKGAVVKLGSTSFGRVIIGSHGKTLYVWAHDRTRRSTCYGKCARAWPPLVTRGKPRAVSGARSALLGTSLRRDGRRQVTYHGHPLYYFVKDRKAGQTAGRTDGLRRTLGPGVRGREPGEEDDDEPALPAPEAEARHAHDRGYEGE